MNICIVALALLFLSVPARSEELITLPRVRLNDIKDIGRGYEVDEDGEVQIKGDFIKRIEVGKNTIAVAFFNKTNEPIQPSVTIMVYNSYGMRIGRVNISWILDSVSPGSKYTDTEKSL